MILSSFTLFGQHRASLSNYKRWDFSGIDLLINTAPARQVDEDSLPPDLDIIDLASGSIFPPSAGLVKLPSIPEQMFPITAGRLYAEAALRALEGRL